MSKLYEITRITDRNGVDRTNGRYPSRIGRRCNLMIFDINLPAFMEYAPRENETYSGVLSTSSIVEVEKYDGIHKIVTLNSVYYLKELE